MKTVLKIFIWLFTATFAQVQAQTYKTGVLVYGEDNCALAAALQSAKSGAKTTLLLPHGKLFLKEQFPIKNFSGMDLCILDTILKTDSLRKLPSNYNEKILKYLDTLNNLSVIKNIDITGAYRKGKYWYVKLNANSEMKMDEIVDASADAKIANYAAKSLKISANIQNLNSKNNYQWQTADYMLARTQLATTYDSADNALMRPFASFLLQGIDHFILTKPVTADSIHVFSNTAIGQAAGAVAAYGSFFKEQTPQLFNANIRIIQTELLNYHLSIFDLKDVTVVAKNWLAIQHTLLCGFFAPKAATTVFNFEPNKKVEIDEIKPVLQNMFFKTAIWFEDHKITDTLNIEQALELVCYLGNKGFRLSKEKIQKNWDKVYGFGTFNPEEPINRIQFAVLIKDYLTAFPLKVDFTGKMRD